MSLNSFDWDFRTAQAGYWVAKPERGKGVATAALRTLTGWAFERLNLSLITLVTLVGNTASERVAENAHFDMVGEMTDYRHPHSPETTLHVKVWSLRPEPRRGWGFGGPIPAIWDTSGLESLRAHSRFLTRALRRKLKLP